MPDSKITALTSISTSTDPANDPLVIVDVSDTSMAATGTTKKVTLNNLLACSPTATLASATITGDLTVDTSTLKVDSGNNRVGVNTASPVNTLHVNGEVTLPINNLQYWNGYYSGGFKSVAAGYAGYTAFATNGDFVLANTDASAAGAGSALTFYNRYRISNAGIHTWETVGGVAGTAMTLNSTGLGVGASPTSKLTIGTGAYAAGTLSGTSSLYSTVAQGLCVLADGFNVATRAGADRFTLDTSGNVGIGVTPSAWASGIKGLQIGSLGGSSIIGYSNACEIGSNFYFDTGYKYGATAASSQIQFTNGEIRFKNAASGTAGTAITYSQPMTLDGSGNLILQPPSSPPTLGTNGQLTVNATSNTNLRFSYRGSDGVTRVANITLA